MNKNKKTPTSRGPVRPAPMETAADKHGRTHVVQPERKKKQLELQGELERSDGPKQAQVVREVQANESKS